MGQFTWKCSQVFYFTFTLKKEKQLHGYFNDMIELLGKKRDLLYV